jgi:hypothetical protein
VRRHSLQPHSFLMMSLKTALNGASITIYRPGPSAPDLRRVLALSASAYTSTRLQNAACGRFCNGTGHRGERDFGELSRVGDSSFVRQTPLVQRQLLPHPCPIRSVHRCHPVRQAEHKLAVPDRERPTPSPPFAVARVGLPVPEQYLPACSRASSEMKTEGTQHPQSAPKPFRRSSNAARSPSTTA